MHAAVTSPTFRKTEKSCGSVAHRILALRQSALSDLQARPRRNRTSPLHETRACRNPFEFHALRHIAECESRGLCRCRFVRNNRTAARRQSTRLSTLDSAIAASLVERRGLTTFSKKQHNFSLNSVNGNTPVSAASNVDSGAVACQKLAKYFFFFFFGGAHTIKFSSR